MKKTLLGEKTIYPSAYAPQLLEAIPRSQSRCHLGIADGEKLPFTGTDIWNCYELSWLDKRGKPSVAMAEIHIPFDSPFIVESKSLKLYLNSINQQVMDGIDDVRLIVKQDIEACVGAPVDITVFPIEGAPNIGGNGFYPRSFDGVCLDGLMVDVNSYTPDSSLLTMVESDKKVVSESLFSHLLKTNCPVTGQPDWASIWINYSGQPIDHKGLLKYIISYRDHQDFHEHCVESIFTDIYRRCKPEKLEVYARYTRRGGIDINPYRTTGSQGIDQVRIIRQ